jgi:hypothetical protein
MIHEEMSQNIGVRVGTSDKTKVDYWDDHASTYLVLVSTTILLLDLGGPHLESCYMFNSANQS